MRMASLRATLALLLLAPWGGAGLVAQQPAPADRFDLVLAIGEAAGPPEYTLHRIGAVAVGAAGEIHVLDGGDRQVKVYSPTGEFLRGMGREGGGPGEFSLPTSLRVDSLVRVFDPRAARITTFGPEGELRSTERLSALAGLPLAAREPLRHGFAVGHTVARHSLGQPSHEPSHLVLLSRGGALDTLARYHSGAVLWHAAGRQAPWGIADAEFGPGGAWTVSGDSLLALADGYTGRLAWHRVTPGGLRLARTGRLGQEGGAVEGRDLRAVEVRLRARRENLPGRIALLPPPRWSVATRAIFDEAGTLWVRNGEGPERGRTWTVFDGRRDVARRVVLPAGFELLAVRSGLLYGRGENADGAPVLRVYRWRPGQAGARRGAPPHRRRSGRNRPVHAGIRLLIVRLQNSLQAAPHSHPHPTTAVRPIQAGRLAGAGPIVHLACRPPDRGPEST